MTELFQNKAESSECDTAAPPQFLEEVKGQFKVMDPKLPVHPVKDIISCVMKAFTVEFVGWSLCV